MLVAGLPADVRVLVWEFAADVVRRGAESSTDAQPVDEEAPLYYGLIVSF